MIIMVPLFPRNPKITPCSVLWRCDLWPQVDSAAHPLGMFVHALSVGQRPQSGTHPAVPPKPSAPTPLHQNKSCGVHEAPHQWPCSPHVLHGPCNLHPRKWPPPSCGATVLVVPSGLCSDVSAQCSIAGRLWSQPI